MHYQNLDLDLHKFFVNKHTGSIHLSMHDLRQECLDPQIYFRPSRSPLLDVEDCLAGSCYQDYWVPTAAWIFDEGGNHDLMPKDMDLASYRERLYPAIQRRLQEIYKQHATVTLAYSGGIDSMVLLSYVYNMGLLPRTDIVTHSNRTQNDASCLHIDHHKSHCVQRLLDLVRDQSRSVTWHDVTMQDIAQQFNHGTINHLKCYASATMLERSPNKACMFGYHGNQVLLHKRIFWDEMICQDSARRQQIRDYLANNTDYYCQSFANYECDTEKITIDRRHHLQKPWAAIDGHAGCSMYWPLADDQDFFCLRRLDILDASVQMIANAELAREIIHRNTQGLWDDLITSESLTDGDSLTPMMIPATLLHTDLLHIPFDLAHDRAGKQYLLEEIDRCHADGAISINSLVSIKNLQALASLQ